jgi:hypothetical protein
MSGSLLPSGPEFIGGITGAYSSPSGNVTLTTSDHLIRYAAGSYTVTLPTAVGDSGREYVITNSGTGVITIIGSSSQTINGEPQQTINQWESITVNSDGLNWIIT